MAYLKKCFSYACSQNENDPVNLAKNLRCILKHCFNDHAKCSANSVPWCGFLKDPNGYKHATIGDGLKNNVLLEAL